MVSSNNSSYPYTQTNMVNMKEDIIIFFFKEINTVASAQIQGLKQQQQHQKLPPPPVAPRPQAQLPKITARILWNYEPVADDGLNVHAGDLRVS
jgi:hypothetical protein